MTRRRPVRRPVAAAGVAVLLVATLAAPVAATPATLPAAAFSSAAPAAVLAASAPEAPTAQATPSPPGNVVAWFAEAGAEAVRDHASELGAAADDLELGPPHDVAHWTEAYLGGDTSAEPAEPGGQWIAGVFHAAPDGREALGVLWAGPFAEDGPETVLVLPDPELGQAVVSQSLAFTLVYDDVVDGWFATAEAEVWPLEAGGRSMLQGSVPLSVFQMYLVERGSTPAPPVDAEEEPEDGGVVVALTIVAVIVLLGLLVAWLLVRNYRKTDSRIEADVRAGLTPPEGVPLR